MTTKAATAATVIFGGTFDPVHFGHLRAAAELHELLGVTDFRLLPAGQPPHRHQPGANGQQRLQMLQLALHGYNDQPPQHRIGMAVDDREIRRPGPSYMVDTLAELRQELGADRPLILVLGQDAANQLQSWHRWLKLFDQAHLIVMTRPDSSPGYTGELQTQMRQRQATTGALLEQATGLVAHQQVTQLAISSTDIRSQFANHRMPRYLMPDRVMDFVYQQGLYK